jgi:hypothetical protein
MRTAPAVSPGAATTLSALLPSPSGDAALRGEAWSRRRRLAGESP